MYLDGIEQLEELEYAKDDFLLEICYPAILTGIHAEAANDTDYNVIFTFWVSNGYTAKEFYQVCPFVYSKGRYIFREFCKDLTFLPYFEDNEEDMDEDDKAECEDLKRTIDLNELVGTYVGVSVIDLPYPRIDMLLDIFLDDEYFEKSGIETYFEDKDIPDYNPAVPQKINDLLHELFQDNNLKRESVWELL